MATSNRLRVLSMGASCVRGGARGWGDGTGFDIIAPARSFWGCCPLASALFAPGAPSLRLAPSHQAQAGRSRQAVTLEGERCQPRNSKALPTTLTLLSAMAAPATTGLSRPAAASGMPITL